MKKIFNSKTRFEDFEDSIEWQETIEYYFNDDRLKEHINDLEIRLNLVLDEKKVEYLKFELKEINTLLKEKTQMEKIETKVNGKEIPIRKHVNNYHTLISSIYKEYLNGDKPTLKKFHALIKNYVSSYLETIKYDPETFLKWDVRFTKFSNIKYGVSIDDATHYIIYYGTLELVADEILEPIRYKKYIEKRLAVLSGRKKILKKQKLSWTGKPAHLAFIIDLLIEKGYLKATPYGERTAKILFDFIEIEGFKNDIEGLGKLLHKDKYPIKDKTVIDRFYKIPNRNEIK